MSKYDFIIIGGGIFGVYSALFLENKGFKIALIEKEKEIMNKASIVNQARLHHGYHYPRSLITAQTANEYRSRFKREHQEFINFSFDHYYGIDSRGSFTSSKDFERFCDFIDIEIEPVSNPHYIKNTRIEKLFLAKEYSFDPIMMKYYYDSKIKERSQIDIFFESTPIEIENLKNSWNVIIKKNNESQIKKIQGNNIINATYANINNINEMAGIKKLDLFYEMTEMCFFSSQDLNRTGLTIMDGHYCSYMPYGLSDLISLSSVSYTPHFTSNLVNPELRCQVNSNFCKPHALNICDQCEAKPHSNYKKMVNQLHQYVNEEVDLQYIFSMFTVKTKLASSYIDDGRPTVIIKDKENPSFYSLFAGKINCIYEIERFFHYV